MTRPIALSCLALTLGCAPAPPTAPPSPPGIVAPDPWAARDAETARRAAALFDAPAETSPIVAHDNEQFVFVSSRDGLPQLYLASTASSAPPRRLAEWPDAMAPIAFTSDDRAVLFAADRGGNELAQFYRLELASGQVELLTPEALGRDGPFLPELAPEQLVYSGRSPDRPETRIYRASSARSGPAEVLYTNEGAGFLVDVSRDGRHGLFLSYRTHQDQRLLVVDLAAGSARPLYPARGVAAVRSASFARDGRSAYVLTDGGGEAALALRIDVESGRELGRYVETSPPTALGNGLVLSRSGGQLALTLDAGNRGEVRLLDAHTMAPQAPARLPLGQGEATAFSADGRRLLVHWSAPDRPTTLASVDTATGAATPLIAPSPLPAAGPVDVAIVSVRSFDGTAIPTNVLRPAAAGRRPVIVHLHGGPAGASKLGWNPEARFFLGEGYAWVEPNVRGSGGFGRAFEAADDGRRRVDSFRDLDAVRAWIAGQPWADPTRLVVLGESYGGFLVLEELARNGPAWRAGIDAFGIADFTTFMASTTGLVRQNYRHELGDPARDAAFLASLSPLRQVERIRSPLFVYAGANDPRVPRAQSDAIVGALRRRGSPVEYMLAADEGHGFARRETKIEYCARVAAFLRRVLAATPPG
ncbi:MAG: prolyl oligopeptidase family serine peptidase [Polyangiaceae bacterium]|nr:prolyl oligopeptidase family serine peptidase [Polyangiaceae bacterium]